MFESAQSDRRVMCGMAATSSARWPTRSAAGPPFVAPRPRRLDLPDGPDEAVAVLGTGPRLALCTGTAVLEQLNSDPDGGVIITVAEREHDPYMTVFAVDSSSEPLEGRAAIGIVEAGS